MILRKVSYNILTKINHQSIKKAFYSKIPTRLLDFYQKYLYIHKKHIIANQYFPRFIQNLKYEYNEYKIKQVNLVRFLQKQLTF